MTFAHMSVYLDAIDSVNKIAVRPFDGRYTRVPDN